MPFRKKAEEREAQMLEARKRAAARQQRTFDDSYKYGSQQEDSIPHAPEQPEKTEAEPPEQSNGDDTNSDGEEE